MANTTNYNWETPDDTDLVKDGAAAIRTLGSSIDTTTKALNPSTTLGDIEYRSATANTNTRLPIGTTGQILSVVGGVPSWVANDVGDITEVQAGTGISVASGTGPIPVITNTVATEFDAKGDLVVGTGADTFDKLTVGANDTILVADSSTATGLKWAAPAGGGGMTLLSTTTLSGATTTISSIDQTYVNLYVEITDMGDNADFRCAPNGTNNISTQVSNWFQSPNNVGSGLATSYINFVQGNGNTDANSIWVLTIYNYASTSARKAFDFTGIMKSGHSGNPVLPIKAGGGINTDTAISSLEFSLSSGSLSGGTVKVYGVK